ncbi:cysteine synthase [Malassezia vespertilionis]|uniref:cysteine synthase n=1 Tax=Malassezia vespertilionis TaxID=2020962 RepID=UPI0024B0EFC9|nr:cysteine synthase [Malassezia vespertilionis]WFD05998.1 cysteine synthase [Malassezia vespertilionis]
MKRVRTAVRTEPLPAHLGTPKRPIPRRRDMDRRAPRSPSSMSPFTNPSRTQRTPGGMFARSSDPASPTLHIASSSPAPPCILVSPPAGDVESLIARSELCMGSVRREVRHEWQFAYISTLLARDQLALEKLCWKLDLTFAALACAKDHDQALAKNPALASSIAKKAAQHTLMLLMNAWRPQTTQDFTYSPPSFRLSSVSRETMEMPQNAAHIAWAQRVSGMLGVQAAEKIVLHIVHTVWYMVVHDANRAFARPYLAAQFCKHFLACTDRWVAQESCADTRKLPFLHLEIGQPGNVDMAPTSTVLRWTFVHALHQKLETALAGMQRRTIHSLQIPSPHTKRAAYRGELAAQALDSKAVVDAARFLGELFCADAVVGQKCVAQWLRLLLLSERPWIAIVPQELEAACALLLLAGTDKTRVRLPDWEHFLSWPERLFFPLLASMQRWMDRILAAFQRHGVGRFGAGLVVGLVVGLGSMAFARFHQSILRKRYSYRLRRWTRRDTRQNKVEDAFVPIELRRSGKTVNGVAGMIGNTPLMRINSLSDMTGCEILGKAEYLNPGGSPKDRVALQILNEAEEDNTLVPFVGSWIFEGTVGSTGISIATLARAKGYNCCIIVPDDVAEEKVTLLRRLGAKIETVRPRGIVDPRHYVKEAKARAQAWKPNPSQPYARAFFADQFENEANFWAHYHHTGPEIWEQTGGRIDAFVAGAGTGGTLAGVAAFFKTSLGHADKNDAPLIVAADPQGSGLYNRVCHGVMYSPTESEGTRRRHQVDSVVEGIGINRLTRNLEKGLPYIDTAERVTDDEAVRMSRWLAAHDGLFLGSSSAVQCVAAVRTALRLKAAQPKPTLSSLEDTALNLPRSVVVTILADSGVRHLSKFQNDEAMQALGLHVDVDISDILFVP